MVYQAEAASKCFFGRIFCPRINANNRGNKLLYHPVDTAPGSDKSYLLALKMQVHGNESKEAKMGKTSLLKGAVAGLVGGLAASFVMNQYQALVMKLTEGNKVPGSQSSEDEPATVKVGEKVSQMLFGHELTEFEKKAADPIVHYAMGGISGMFYGALAEVAPRSSAGLGLPFGTGVWAILDEVMVPALGLSKSSLEFPLSNHAYSLSSHLVYGLTTDVVRKGVRKLL
jgi:putative membrane protein